jgi:glyoxylase-like metal-dependent hydrolase (beta-lactamase superfamily II)
MPIPLVLRPLLTILAVTGLLASPRGQAGPSNEDVRLYAIDCGGAYFDDIAAAADTGEYDGRPGRLVDPCFLIRHPRGWLLWDTGMPPTFPDDQKAVFDKMGVRPTGYAPLVEQLHVLNLQPADIGFIAFSHLHFDHVGNAGLFTGATWIRIAMSWNGQAPTRRTLACRLHCSRRIGAPRRR